MENENLEEEVLDQETTPTEEEIYNAEYEKAWNGEETETTLEQPETEEEATDEKVEDEVVEDSIEEEEVTNSDEESNDEKPSDDFAEVLKWKGKEIPVTREELIALSQKGFDAEKKWQDVASIRPYHKLITDNDLTVEQVTTLVDIVKNKNPEALALLAEQSNIDVLDAERKEYAPQVEDTNYDLNDVIEEINRTPETATQLNDYVSGVPQKVKDSFSANPEILRGLNTDMQNGIAQKVMPEVIKQYALNPNQDFVSLYQEVGQKVFAQEEVKAPAKEAKVATRDDKKRVAVSKKTPAPDKSVTNDYDASWDDDAHYEAVRRRLSGF